MGGGEPSTALLPDLGQNEECRLVRVKRPYDLPGFCHPQTHETAIERLQDIAGAWIGDAATDPVLIRRDAVRDVLDNDLDVNIPQIFVHRHLAGVVTDRQIEGVM